MARILHILDHSLPLHSGYCFRTRAILKAQLDQGHVVAGLTGVRHGRALPAGAALADEETVDGLHFYRTPRAIGGPPLLREWREVAALASRMSQMVERWRPDILHAHSPALNGLAAARVARAHGLPFLYEIRAFWEDASVGNGTGRTGSLRYNLTRQLENHVVARADAVAVICEGLKRDLIARGVPEAKIMVSPNGVDMALFGDPPPPDLALARQLGLGKGPVLGFIGSFYDYEGLDDLIAAMPLIRARIPDAALLLVGGGPMEAALRAQATASRASDAIRFVGRVPHGEVERYYSLIDILVYPRKRMRLTDLVTPLKPLEAMAQRRLVAASDVGGHAELIEHGRTGTLFPADKPEALAASIAEMVANRAEWPARRDAARQFVAEQRNWQVNIERYQPVYQMLLGRTAGSGTRLRAA